MRDTLDLHLHFFHGSTAWPCTDPPPTSDPALQSAWLRYSNRPSRRGPAGSLRIAVDVYRLVWTGADHAPQVLWASYHGQESAADWWLRTRGLRPSDAGLWGIGASNAMLLCQVPGPGDYRLYGSLADVEALALSLLLIAGGADTVAPGRRASASSFTQRMVKARLPVVTTWRGVEQSRHPAPGVVVLDYVSIPYPHDDGAAVRVTIDAMPETAAPETWRATLSVRPRLNAPTLAAAERDGIDISAPPAHIDVTVPSGAGAGAAMRAAREAFDLPAAATMQRIRGVAHWRVAGTPYDLTLERVNVLDT